MRHPVKVPQLTETMSEATIATWHKSIGDHVKKREALYEVETDKATQDVESVDEGYLCEITVPEGGTARVGEQIAVIADSRDEC